MGEGACQQQISDEESIKDDPLTCRVCARY